MGYDMNDPESRAEFKHFYGPEEPYEGSFQEDMDYYDRYDDPETIARGERAEAFREEFLEKARRKLEVRGFDDEQIDAMIEELDRYVIEEVRRQ